MQTNQTLKTVEPECGTGTVLPELRFNGTTDTNEIDKNLLIWNTLKY